MNVKSTVRQALLADVSDIHNSVAAPRRAERYRRIMRRAIEIQADNVLKIYHCTKSLKVTSNTLFNIESGMVEVNLSNRG